VRVLVGVRTVRTCSSDVSEQRISSIFRSKRKPNRKWAEAVGKLRLPTFAVRLEEDGCIFLRTELFGDATCQGAIVPCTAEQSAGGIHAMTPSVFARTGGPSCGGCVH
jgi:hypothetical protein